jgi:hypothetical protein
MSLSSCLDCDSLYSNWNFECFAKTYCNEDSNLGLCQLYTNLYRSAFAYYLLEVASLLMGILLLEKVGIMIVRTDYGAPWTVYAAGGLMLAFHLTGVCLWFGLAQASWSSSSTSTSSIYQTPSLAILDGPKVSISNLILMGITVLYLFTVFYRRPSTQSNKPITLKKFFWIKGRYWIYILLGLLMISCLLILASLTTPSWVTQYGEEGSLTRCHNCDNKIDWMSWDCLSGRECSIDSFSSSCDFYSKMSNSSKAYIVLETISLFMLILFGQTLTYLISGKQYGINVLNYVYCIAASFFNLLAIIVWFGITNSKFTHCNLCAKNGPSFAVSSQFFLTPMAAIFCFIYYSRSDGLLQKEKTDNSFSDKVIDLTNGTIIFTESPKKTVSNEAVIKTILPNNSPRDFNK